MTIANAIKTLTKAGFAVTENRHDFTARRNGSRHFIEFSRNGRSEDVTCIRYMRDGWKDDLQQDYFAGCWMENMKRAIEFVNRKEAE